MARSLPLFLSTLSLRRATRGQRPSWGGCLFLSTLSLRRATVDEIPYQCQIDQFLSTLSLRRATETAPYKVWETQISIHALLAESDTSAIASTTHQTISIHALLAESDNTSIAGRITSNDFYPRSPCGERQPATGRNDKNNIFLSTLSLRRATSKIPLHCCLITNFYPRSPCGERQISPHSAPDNGNFYPRSPCGERPLGLPGWLRTLISIHALLAESDSKSDTATAFPLSFLSTLSLRRATLHCNTPNILRHYFYPRSPCGERHSER